MHNSKKIGKVRHHFLIVESTNDLARDMLSKTKPSSGSVIITDFQKKGRGQLHNSWESEPAKNCLCSIILLHQIHAEDYFYLNKVICIALVETLSQLIPNETIEIKWPNDILVNRKKIAGILIENAIIQNQLHHSIVGIGLNINQVAFTYPNAISIKNITQSDTDLEKFYEILFSHIDNWYQNMLLQKYRLIDSIYTQLLYGYQKEILYQVNDDCQSGSITAISKDGSITIQNSDSKLISSYYFKQVSFIL